MSDKLELKYNGRGYGRTALSLNIFKHRQENEMLVLCFDKKHAEKALPRYSNIPWLKAEIVEADKLGQPITIVEDGFHGEPKIRLVPNLEKDYHIKLTKAPTWADKLPAQKTAQD